MGKKPNKNGKTLEGERQSKKASSKEDTQPPATELNSYRTEEQRQPANSMELLPHKITGKM